MRVTEDWHAGSPLLDETRAILITCRTLYTASLRKCRMPQALFSRGLQRSGVPAFSPIKSKKTACASEPSSAFSRAFADARKSAYLVSPPKFHGIAHRRECCQQAFA